MVDYNDSIVLLLDQLRNALGHLGEIFGHQDIVPRKDQVDGGF